MTKVSLYTAFIHQIKAKRYRINSEFNISPKDFSACEIKTIGLNQQPTDKRTTNPSPKLASHSSSPSHDCEVQTAGGFPMPYNIIYIKKGAFGRITQAWFLPRASPVAFPEWQRKGERRDKVDGDFSYTEQAFR